MPCGLVEWKASNSCPSSANPTPVSATAIITPARDRAHVTRIERGPPSTAATASTALASRLSNAWRSGTASPRTGGTAGRDLDRHDGTRSPGVGPHQPDRLPNQRRQVDRPVQRRAPAEASAAGWR